MKSIELQVEGRILASLIVEPDIVDSFDSVELTDFTDYRHQAVFCAIRALQDKRKPIDVLAILDHIEAEDARLEKHMAEHANGAWLAEMLFNSISFRWPELAELHVSMLRGLADRRRDQARAA